jgi:DNA mismatch repair protein MutL
LGFDVAIIDDTKIEIKGYPADSTSVNITGLFKDILQACMDETIDVETDKKEKIAMQMAKVSAVPYGKSLSHDEMRELVDHLFGCGMPNFSPSGKTILQILNLDEIEKRF